MKRLLKEGILPSRQQIETMYATEKYRKAFYEKNKARIAEQHAQKKKRKADQQTPRATRNRRLRAGNNAGKSSMERVISISHALVSSRRFSKVVFIVYYLYCRVNEGKLAVLDARSHSTTVVSQRGVTSAIVTMEEILSPVKKSKK